MWLGQQLQFMRLPRDQVRTSSPVRPIQAPVSRGYLIGAIPPDSLSSVYVAWSSLENKQKKMLRSVVLYIPAPTYAKTKDQKESESEKK